MHTESEEDIHMTIARLLDARGVLFFHPPNASKSAPHYRAKLHKLGVRKGVPDLIILDAPPRKPFYHGAALELKKRGGRATPEQKRWIDDLAGRGWATAITRGYEETVAQLREWGYLPEKEAKR